MKKMTKAAHQRPSVRSIPNQMMYRCAMCFKQMQGHENVVGAKKDGIRVWFHRKCLNKIQET